MCRIEYASELDPLLELSLPADWIDAIVLEPGYLLVESDLPEDRLLGQYLSGGDGEQRVATRLAFLCYRGVDPDEGDLPRDNQITASYDAENGQYELSSVQAETTVQTADAAVDWVDDQFLAVETFVDTYPVLFDLADNIHGLGRAGVRGLAETFATLDAILEADIEVLADVPYVDEENTRALQTALEDVDTVGETDPTPLEQALRSVNGPLILDLQDGPISGELVPSGASEPKYRSEGVGGTEPDTR